MSKNRNRRRQAMNVRHLNRMQINTILQMEPYIRVHDRRPSFVTRQRQHIARTRIAQKLMSQSPRRQARVRQNLFLKSVLPKEVYKKVHDCKREWRTLLSWRAAQGSGRSRSIREKRNSKSNFQKRDC